MVIILCSTYLAEASLNALWSLFISFVRINSVLVDWILSEFHIPSCQTFPDFSSNLSGTKFLLATCLSLHLRTGNAGEVRYSMVSRLIPCLFLSLHRLGLMAAGGLVLASFMTYASEHLAIRAFFRGLDDRDRPRTRSICLLCWLRAAVACSLYLFASCIHHFECKFYSFLLAIRKFSQLCENIILYQRVTADQDQGWRPSADSLQLDIWDLQN